MGPPGAGKTTWTDANLGVQVLCSTERIRRDRSMHERSGAIVVYLAKLRAKAEESLAAGRDALVDGCNTRRGDRSTWLTLARKHDARTRLVVLDTPLDALLAAQRARAHPVAEDKVRGYHEEFRRALGVIRGEGWDQIDYVRRGAPTTATRAPASVKRGGSTRRWRRLREYVLARDGYRCRAHADGWCDQVQGRTHTCRGDAPLSGPRPGHAHHTKGHSITGDDPAHMVASCSVCNLFIGEPIKHVVHTPQPKRISRW